MRQFIAARPPGQEPDDTGGDTRPAGLETGDGEQAGEGRDEDNSG